MAGAPTGNTEDAVIETLVQGKLQSDQDVGTSLIDVDASKGEVTLKGSAATASQVGRAIALALDTQGVTKVSSEIKVSSAAGGMSGGAASGASSSSSSSKK